VIESTSIMPGARRGEQPMRPELWMAPGARALAARAVGRLMGCSSWVGFALLGAMVVLAAATDASAPMPGAFYLPAQASYSIVDSVRDSMRFTLQRTVRPDDRGHLVSTSSFVDPAGRPMGWHDFGNLEGPGWAANAVGGAWEIHRWSVFTGCAEGRARARRILEHVLDCGFIDPDSGLIRGYRETTTGRFVLNYRHNSDWFCPGSMAKVAFQLLSFADNLGSDPLAARMRAAALRCARWLDSHLENVPNGWYPRRVTPDGRVYRRSPDGGSDPFWQTSADGLFILQFQAALTVRGLADYRAALREKADVFRHAGGIFGSINHDTYDPRENVAYSVAFRTLRAVASVLQDDSIGRFAHEICLAGLERFKMTQDRNGVATRGLLFMEDSWDTAYLWENAEAALALFEAAADLRATDPERARRHELDGLVILRAIARHHHGPFGFLTEGVDWNNHVGQQHHVAFARYAAIRYTEPIRNTLHLAEPTRFYLEHLARRVEATRATTWVDLEGNQLWRQRHGVAKSIPPR
jgi:hypothetical protein